MDDIPSQYINKEGKEESPIILHRALLGSIERFIGILLEHYNGKLPLWLNPNGIKIIPVNEEHLSYALNVKEKIKKELNIEISIDYSNNSLSYKMRDHFKNKGNYSIIIGDKEVESNMISVRDKKKNHIMSIEDFIIPISLPGFNLKIFIKHLAIRKSNPGSVGSEIDKIPSFFNSIKTS